MSETTNFQPVHAADIQAAQARISSVIEPTPLQYCPRLSQQYGVEVYLKREDLQDVRSYKIRGAYYNIANLTPEEKAAGVVAASAGNHAQGVAYACRAMGIRGKIFVPKPTPKQKRDRILVHGGDAIELVVVGNSFDEAAEAARADAIARGATVVEPFDARATMVGQGTVAAEILSQLTGLGRELGSVAVPVGGGGLLAGVASYLADMSPLTSIIAVEPKGAASLHAALAQGEPVTLESIDPFVDGAAVKRIGALPFQVIDANLSRIHMVIADEGAVCTEMLSLYQNEGIIAEPAGALAVTGLNGVKFEPGSTVVCIISGGNNDVLRYAEIMERSLIHRGLKHYFLVNFPQEPGQLRTFLTDILGPDDDIVLFEYLKKNNRETGTALVGLELTRARDLEPLMERMDASPIDCRRLQPGTQEYDFIVSG
ncbi:threonine ammonia-lyase IlvA [Corynebacterium sanguinis]|uniref:L-threonine dehydratase n=1 Tax=Corynebacterium sanguinis TaxID=2594913 RepID=A0A6C1TZF3_9CORY|nr:threonine ammonia-lyase IlvA [Corynebacterium sanguinis]MBA4504581.1 threonine ammonia-lyase IlvA [Corynebacterium sanguinis]MCT1411856.1 threonine ammonia-lyase IlvA [Corynebacterium sanguinis]MCT1413189.1 threonine ammonia-lyase IlvA [Corynebacterium sanguinis]MCT1424848.1 threonine ammonia-lyase IlvA [Corynebacterium sanguinis]MCT1443819.1 threonine ammonia-lyase IlvA [Corynebacterium sanguinis]